MNGQEAIKILIDLTGRKISKLENKRIKTKRTKIKLRFCKRFLEILNSDDWEIILLQISPIDLFLRGCMIVGVPANFLKNW